MNWCLLFRQAKAGIVVMALLLFSTNMGVKADSSSVLLELGCQQCHNDLSRAVKDSDVKECPRTRAVNQSSRHSLAEAPDSFLLTNPADGHDPVCFRHGWHAQMAEMGDKCITCHHYCPARGIVPCDACHGPKSQFAGLVPTDMEEACHHVCVGCHKEWDRQTRCNSCHSGAADAAGGPSESGNSPPYPPVPTPARKVYRTSYRPYPMVTFQHVEHIELFEFACSDCHRHEECARCHDPVRSNEHAKSHEEIRDICSGCHDTAEETSDESCIKCHDAEEKPLIFHPIVGYKIPVYWRWLTCSSCHPKRTQGNFHRRSWSAGSLQGNTPVNSATVTSPETSIIERTPGWSRTVWR